jgi:hypothetical protein
LIPFLALSFLASGAFVASNNSNEAYHGPIKVIKVNKEFMVALESNPTTGYFWVAKFNPEYIQPVNSAYISLLDLEESRYLHSK